MVDLSVVLDKAAGIADPSGRLAEYLRSSTYRSDPASVSRHRCYSGGLADHCLGVYLHLRALGSAYCASVGIEPWPDRAYALIALCHDLCKVGTYQRCTKSQKRKDENGRVIVDFRGKPVWEDVAAYEYVPRKGGIVLGHGDASLFRTLELIPGLASIDGWGEDAATAIRYHMGPYGAAPGEEQLRLQEANQRPLVLLTQAADQLDTFGVEDSETVRTRAASTLGIEVAP